MPRPKKKIRHSKIVDIIAARVRALREARGMTQRELAERVNTTISYIPRLESSGVAPGIDMVERIAASLGVHITELLPTVQPQTEDAEREQIKGLFGAVMNKAGRDTLLLLKLFLTNCTESTATNR